MLICLPLCASQIYTYEQLFSLWLATGTVVFLFLFRVMPKSMPSVLCTNISQGLPKCSLISALRKAISRGLYDTEHIQVNLLLLVHILVFRTIFFVNSGSLELCGQKLQSSFRSRYARHRPYCARMAVDMHVCTYL